jgi:hypothetical protein
MNGPGVPPPQDPAGSPQPPRGADPAPPSLRWYPEPYAATGGIAAAGFLRLLQLPDDLDPLTVLVRETAQNSWDARTDDGAVRYRLEIRDVAADQWAWLRASVFTGRLHDTLRALRNTIRAPGGRLLLISDRGTRGLGGPTLANTPDPAGVYDWAHLVLTVGEANTQGLSGGTYGFGKTIAYTVSNARAVIIHSRFGTGDGYRSRIIAAALGGKYTDADTLRTGRHWWGASSRHPSPLEDRDADALADALGLPPFGDGETGTTIAVIDPDLGGRTAAQATRHLAEAVLWHLWPKITPRAPGAVAAMHAEVLLDGRDIPIAAPSARPPLDAYVTAWQALNDPTVPEGRRRDGLEKWTVSSLRPRQRLGTLVTVPVVTLPRPPVDDGAAGSDEPGRHATPFPEGRRSHHCALLRGPELVVGYRPGAGLTDGAVEWAAVFRADDVVNGAYAASEPPTHDHWDPKRVVDKSERRLVNVGLREIDKLLESRWATSAKPVGPTGGGPTVAAIGDLLADLVLGTPGNAPGPPVDTPPRTGGGAGGGRGTRPAVTVVSGRPVLHGERPATAITIDVRRRDDEDVTVRLTPHVALDGGVSGADLDPQLAVVAITGVDGRPLRFDLDGDAAVVDVPADEPSLLTVTIRRSPDSSVALDASITRDDP